jgi:branched-subunit amino acid transport protein
VSTNEFLVMYVCVLVPMLVCRCAPLFLLKGRELSPAVREAIELIPPAAFAALVANDLFQPQAFATGRVAALIPFAAALPVLVVARRTNSLIWSAVVGMVAYAALLAMAG